MRREESVERGTAMKGGTFDRNQTNIAKGLFAVAMVVHHTAIEWNDIKTMFLSQQCMYTIIALCKICVPGFVFLTAFGMSRQYQRISEGGQISTREYLKISMVRLVKLYFTFWPVYLLGLVGTWIYNKEIVFGAYRDFGGKFSVFYLILDAMGLSYFCSTPMLNVTWWYFAVALFIIFAMPLMHILYQKLQWLIVLPALFLLPYETVPVYHVYVGIAFLGIMFSQETYLEKVKNLFDRISLLTVIKYVLAVPVMLIMYEISNYLSARAVSYPILVCGFLLLSYLIVADIPVIRSIFALLGRHSGNIFFVHTFIYLYWFRESIYRLNYIVLVDLSVIGISLAISIAVEALKKVTGYNRMQEKIETRIQRL